MARLRVDSGSVSPLRTCELQSLPDGSLQLRFRRTGHGIAHLVLWTVLLVILVGGVSLPVLPLVLRDDLGLIGRVAVLLVMLPYAALLCLAMLRHPSARRSARVRLAQDGRSLQLFGLQVETAELVGPMLFPYYFAGNDYYSLELLFRARPPLRLAVDRSTRGLVDAAEALNAWLGSTGAAQAREAGPDAVLESGHLEVRARQVQLPAPARTADPSGPGDEAQLEFYELTGPTGQGRIRRTRGCLEISAKGPLAPVLVTSLGLLPILGFGAYGFAMQGQVAWPCIWLPAIVLFSVAKHLWAFLEDTDLQVRPDGRVTLRTRPLGLPWLEKTRGLGKVTFQVAALGENKGLALMAHSAREKPFQVWRSSASTDLQRICLSLQALLGQEVDGSQVVQAVELPAGPVFYHDRVSEIRWSSTPSAEGAPPDISLACRLRRWPLLADYLGAHLLAAPLYALGLVPLFQQAWDLGTVALGALSVLIVGVGLWRWGPLARCWQLRIGPDGPQLTRGSETGQLLEVDMQVTVEPLTVWPRFKKGSRLVLRSGSRRFLLAGAAHAGFLSALEHALRDRLEGPPEDWLPTGPSRPGEDVGGAAYEAAAGEV